MANNTVLNVGAGGDTLRDLDRSGVKTPIVAIDLNPAGSETLMAGAMPVTGTFWQATQPISGTVTANAGTGTFAISAAALPLPAGASTSAKQATLGTAGTASADVLTVQGIASMTALKVDGSAVTQPVSGTFWQATQPISGTITANAGTNTSTAALALEAGGHLASVDTKLPALGQALAAASVPVVLTASQLTTLTPAASVAVTQATAANLNATVVGTGTFTVQAAQSGTWNVGTVTTVTTVSAVTAITNALPAGTNLLGKVSSGLDTSTINNGTTALTPKFASISTNASGLTTVVAAVTSKKIRVLSYRFQADGDVSVKFRDNTAAVDLTGAMAAGAKGGGGGASFSPVGHFETAAGNALSINLSGAIQVSGHLAYVEV